MRKIYLNNLPKKYGFGANKNKLIIDWGNCVDKVIKFIYNNIESELKIIDYKDGFLYVNYQDKKMVKMKTNTIKKCQLGKLLNNHTSDFKIEVGTIFKDCTRDLIIIGQQCRDKKRKNAIERQKYYKYKCNKCGWDKGWVLESNLLKGVGCSCCGKAPKTVVEGINDIPTTAPWMVKYFQGGYDEAKKYTKSSDKQIKFKCPDCGNIKKGKISNLYNRKSISCSCGDGKSYPEKIMFNLLKQLNINFKTEYSPEWCIYKLNNKNKKGRYDYYFKLNNKKYIIEMDGGWHKRDNKMSGQLKKESKFIDKLKENLAQKHNINIIRIDCEQSDLEFIKNNILHSKLNELFNLKNINWIKCEEFALNNLIKKVCNLFNNNINLTAVDLSIMTNMSHTTIIYYLKKGSKLNWCNYNSKEEYKKSILKKRKKVEVFKDGVSLGIFESISYLEQNSMDLFGTKMTLSCISKVCKKERKSHKGFQFKFYSEARSNRFV